MGVIQMEKKYKSSGLQGVCDLTGIGYVQIISRNANNQYMQQYCKQNWGWVLVIPYASLSAFRQGTFRKIYGVAILSIFLESLSECEI